MKSLVLKQIKEICERGNFNFINNNLGYGVDSLEVYRAEKSPTMGLINYVLETNGLEGRLSLEKLIYLFVNTGIYRSRKNNEEYGNVEEELEWEDIWWELSPLTDKEVATMVQNYLNESY